MKIALRVSFLVSIIGMLDVILKLYYVDISYALFETSHDPGKALFSIVILPVALFLITLFLRNVDFSIAFSGVKRIINILIIFLLACLIIVIGYSDSQNGFFERGAMPWDFSDKKMVEKLEKYRIEGWSEINLKLESGELGDLPEQKKFRKTIHDGYREELKKGEYKEDVSFGGYLKHASMKKFLADILTLLGIITAALLIGLLAVSISIRKSVEPSHSNYLYLAFYMLALWVPFRLYSEWHGNFGYEYGTNSAVLLGFLAVILIGFLLFLFKRKTMKPIITAAGITFLCTLIATIAAVSPETFEKIAVLFSKSPPYVLITFYGLISIALIAGIGASLEGNKELTIKST